MDVREKCFLVKGSLTWRHEGDGFGGYKGLSQERVWGFSVYICPDCDSKKESWNSTWDSTYERLIDWSIVNHHQHHHHLSLNHEGRWGTTDNFATSFLHFSPVLHCPLGPGEHQACPFPDVVFQPLPLSALSSSPFQCAWRIKSLGTSLVLQSVPAKNNNTHLYVKHCGTAKMAKDKSPVLS